MIDLHCHILPRLDDGSASMEESIDMARLAVASGVTDIAATPHFRGEMESVVLGRQILQRLEELRQALNQEKIPLKLHPGAEILCLPGTMDMARQRLLPTIGDGGYILTEFYFNESWEEMNRILTGLSQLGYRPVVAHPERYGTIQRDPRRIREWFAQGYAIQVNKGSILGAFGGRAKQTAQRLLEDGLVHVIASDAHGADMRTPHMGAVERWAEENLNPNYWQILLEENPDRILRGTELVPAE